MKNDYFPKQNIFTENDIVLQISLMPGFVEDS